MSKKTVTIQINLDLRAVVLLSVVLLLLGLIIAPSVAGAFPRRDDPELQAYDATNAHKVDNHHAGPSSGTLNQRKNRVLWANNQGQLSWRAMPKAALNSRYLNDDRKEHISAAVPGPSGILLHVENTASGSGTIGLYATAGTRGVFGSSDTGTGTSGYSKSGSGAWGYSESGHGVDAFSESGLPLSVWGFSGGNLIEAWDEGAEPDDLRFKVTRSGDVHADGSFYAGQDVSVSGLLRVGQYSADPASCDGTTEGSIYYNTTDNMFYGCNGGGWMALHGGPTPGLN